MEKERTRSMSAFSGVPGRNYATDYFTGTKPTFRTVA